MEKLNMLSAKKVKLHGMTSDRWTTRDKITQYKGLINLYSRDRKIIDSDTAVSKRKQKENLKKLQKLIEINRTKLDNAVKGNKQQLRNILAEHRGLQLAYQNSSSKKVVECIHQNNFNLRKELDKLEYQMNVKSQNLIDIKLLHALYEDRVKFEGISSLLPIEKDAQIITGKVQDAFLKKEAAIAIRHTYKQMIAIMKKDALYFDAVLETIRNDGLNQGNCMINATKLGQLATEYLDDRRQEYKLLEEAVKRDLFIRKQDVVRVREEVLQAAANIKNLLRRDSDINLGKVEIQESLSETQLKQDVSKIIGILDSLKDATLVPSFDHIFPCLKTQMEHKERLEELTQRYEENRDILLNKKNHAELMKNVMDNTMIETTFAYKNEKKELKEKIEDQNLRRKHLTDLLKNRYNLMARVRIALYQMQQLCNFTNTEEKEIIEEEVSDEDDECAREPIKEETDGSKMIPNLVKKLTKLVGRTPDKEVVDEGYKMFEQMINDRTRIIQLQSSYSEESLTQGLVTEISNILTREDIKRNSAELVAQNTKTDDQAPVKVVSKKKKKFK